MQRRLERGHAKQVEELMALLEREQSKHAGHLEQRVEAKISPKDIVIKILQISDFHKLLHPWCPSLLSPLPQLSYKNNEQQQIIETANTRLVYDLGDDFDQIWIYTDVHEYARIYWSVYPHRWTASGWSSGLSSASWERLFRL